MFTTKRRKMRRGAVSSHNCTRIVFLVPEPLAARMDRAVRQLDLDRSKLMRQALEEKLSRMQKQAA